MTDPCTEDGDAPAPQRPSATEHDRPLLPDQSVDETDVGWGERPEPDDRDRMLQDRPPHWDDY